MERGPNRAPGLRVPLRRRNHRYLASLALTAFGLTALVGPSALTQPAKAPACTALKLVAWEKTPVFNKADPGSQHLGGFRKNQAVKDRPYWDAKPKSCVHSVKGPKYSVRGFRNQTAYRVMDWKEQRGYAYQSCISGEHG